MAFNKLSILFERDGFSFCTIKDNALTHQENILFDTSETQLQEELNNAFNTNLYLQQSYDAVFVSYLGRDFNIIPNSYFEKDPSPKNWIEFNQQNLENHTFTTTNLPDIHAKLVCAIPLEINTIVEEKFGIKEITSASALFINNIAIDQSEPQVFVNVHKNSLELMAYKEGKLIFYNIFDAKTKEDILYYTLTVFEKLNLSPNTVKLYFFGLFNNNENLKMMMNFVRHVIPGTSDVTALRYYTETINHLS